MFDGNFVDLGLDEHALDIGVDREISSISITMSTSTGKKIAVGKLDINYTHMHSYDHSSYTWDVGVPRILISQITAAAGSYRISNVGQNCEVLAAVNGFSQCELAGVYSVDNPFLTTAVDVDVISVGDAVGTAKVLSIGNRSIRVQTFSQTRFALHIKRSGKEPRREQMLPPRSSLFFYMFYMVYSQPRSLTYPSIP
jgi:hypothetical protein